MVPPEHTFTVGVPGGWKMHLRRWGSGTPLVLVHGFTGSSLAWPSEALTELAQRYAVVAVDLPGHGHSSIPSGPHPLSFHTLLGDLAAGLAEVGLERFHLLGYSMGGRVALGFALRYPERVASLVLESASPGLADAEARGERAAEDESLAERIEARGIEWFVDHWTRKPLFESQRALAASVQEGLRLRRLDNRPTGLALVLRSLGTGMQPSYWEALGRLTPPTRFIVGSLDAKFRTLAQRMEGQVPRGAVEVVAGAGHAVHLESPVRWREVLLNHLAAHGRLDPSGPSC